MDGLAFVLLFVGWIAFTTTAGIWNFVRSRKRVDRWAAENGYTLQRCEWHFLSDSPFREGLLGYRKSGLHVVWTVRAVGPDKVQKDAWIQCGSYFLGMLSDRIEVAWAKPGESAFK